MSHLCQSTKSGGQRILNTHTMKSSIKMDLDHKHRSMLVINSFQTDDVRDKIINTFKNDLCWNQKEPYIKISLEESSNRKPDDVSKLSLTIMDRETYANERFLSGQQNAGPVTTTNFYLKGIPNDVRENHFKESWPSTEIKKYGDVEYITIIDNGIEQKIASRYTIDHRDEFISIGHALNELPDEFCDSRSFSQIVEALVQYYNSTIGIKECPDCKFDFVNWKHVS